MRGRRAGDGPLGGLTWSISARRSMRSARVKGAWTSTGGGWCGLENSIMEWMVVSFEEVVTCRFQFGISHPRQTEGLGFPRQALCTGIQLSRRLWAACLPCDCSLQASRKIAMRGCPGVTIPYWHLGSPEVKRARPDSRYSLSWTDVAFITRTCCQLLAIA